MRRPASRSNEPERRIPRFDPNAPQLLVLSFAALVTGGWLGFLVLPGLYTGAPMDWVDALFISASAVCVTGLASVDVPVVLSFWGELWLLLLIQAGGLGILTFAAIAAAAVGRRAGLDVEEASGSFTAILPSGTPRQMLRTILGFTLGCEAVGVLALIACWWPAEGFLRALWLAVFHSISAFCNAGFSLFSDSLVGQQRHASVVLVVAFLIVLGGLGFPVVHDLRMRWRGKRRVTTHTRVVLVTTGLLIGVGTLAFLAYEWNNALAGLSLADRLANAVFMSVTPRTAGFNTVDYGAVSDESVLLTIALMWIGGASASTAGGAKVTTVALLGILLFVRLRGDRHVSIAGRTVPDETVHRASGLAVGMVVLLLVFTMGLLTLEEAASLGEDPRRLVRLGFEVQSALSTVGLSMNVTPFLNDASKLLLVLVMFLGRVGPLAILGSMVQRAHHADYRHPHEDVLIG